MTPDSDFASALTNDPEIVHGQNPIKVLVVDDAMDMHAITKLALAEYRFENRPVELLHATSAEEAYKILNDNADISLGMIDVVMETEHAGLHLVKRIRNELGNTVIRLMLRTGQPGKAPINEVMQKFDINDYRVKEDLKTQTDLKAAIHNQLTAHRDILIRAQKLEAVKKNAESEISTINQTLSNENATPEQTRDLLVHIKSNLQQMVVDIDQPPSSAKK
jgi:CheY-like chemotaxis protein